MQSASTNDGRNAIDAVAAKRMVRRTQAKIEKVHDMTKQQLQELGIELPTTQLDAGFRQDIHSVSTWGTDHPQDRSKHIGDRVKPPGMDEDLSHLRDRPEKKAVMREKRRENGKVGKGKG